MIFFRELFMSIFLVVIVKYTLNAVDFHGNRLGAHAAEVAKRAAFRWVVALSGSCGVGHIAPALEHLVM